MPRKAFLKKKSLLDRFKDDYATHTGYIQSARAKHTWNNPLTRRKRTKELNRWIKSFAGKDHIHKLARFNATNAGRYESMYDEAMSLKGFLENLTEKLTKQFDLDLEEVQAYLNSHTQEMQELLNDTELSLKEKVLFVRSEITGEQNEKKSEKLVVSNPCVVYKGDAENAAKAHDYLYKKMPRVKGASISSDVKPLGNNKFCRVLFYGNNTGVMDLFGYYSNLYNDDFWNNCDADPQGWVDPLTINKYDVATPRQESNETDEKLGYEKGHKNSRGENAPWVIRSHEDNRILASFANKKDAEEHLKRMKQYSKTESKVNEEAEIKDKQYYLDMFDKAYKECVQLAIDDGRDAEDWADYFTDTKNYGDFTQKEADEIVGYYMEFHPEGDGEPDRPYRDWLDNTEGLELTPLDKEITRILKALYAPNESKQSEALETYACFIDFATEDDAKKGMEIVKGWHPFRNDTAVLIDSLGEDAANRLWNDWKQKCVKAGLAISDAGEVYKEEPTCFYGNESKKSETKDRLAGYKPYSFKVKSKDPTTLKNDAEAVLNEFAEDVADNTTFKFEYDWYDKSWELIDTENNVVFMKGGFLFKDFADAPLYLDDGISEKPAGMRLRSWMTYSDEDNKSEAHNLKNYTSNIISKLDGIYACGLNGAKRLAEKYADVIQQNYTDGDLSTAETAKFIAGQENLTESRKKTESKQSEVHLELIDTIIVPKWLWEAHTFGNEYGEDLDEHEQEILAKFEEEYGKQYYLDDRSEEADFRSRNDFDEYGGPCYEVDVYKMS